MLRRVAVGVVSIAGVLAVVGVDARIAERAYSHDGLVFALLSRGSAIPLVLTALYLIAALEMNRLLRLRGIQPHSFFACMMIVALMLAPWFSAAGWLGHGASQVEGVYWQVVLLMAAAIGASVLVVLRGNPEGAMRDYGATLLMIVLLGFLGSFGVQLRCGRDIPHEQGAWVIMIVVLVTKSSDIGAFLVGSTIGRHKLMPALSPGKSVEGTIAGLCSSAILALLFSSAATITETITGLGIGADFIGPGSERFDWLERVTWSLRRDQAMSPLPPAVRAVLFGLVLSAAGQFGDLIESCFKRDAGIKDSGDVIPQYGGILDLIDSLLPALPIAWLLLTVVWGVV